MCQRTITTTQICKWNSYSAMQAAAANMLSTVLHDSLVITLLILLPDKCGGCCSDLDHSQHESRLQERRGCYRCVCLCACVRACAFGVCE